ncbi:MAG: hypothetical protein ABEN55_16610, partial [Bradymonadaceae bacterium]
MTRPSAFYTILPVFETHLDLEELMSTRIAPQLLRPLLVIVAAITATVTCPEVASAESPTEVRLSERGLVGVGPDGKTRWTLPHIFKIRDRHVDTHDQYPRPDFPTVRLGDRVYYVMNADLLEIDPRLGKIVDRYRFPTQIVGLARADNGQLRVTLNFRPYEERTADPPDDSDMVVDVTYTPGDPAPGRGPAGIISLLTPTREVVYTLEYGPSGKQVREHGLTDLDDQTYRTLLDRLTERAKRNPTNPFYHFYRALLF